VTTSTYDPLMSDRTTSGSTTVDTTTMLSGGAHTHRRISWAAIFGGVIVVVAIQLLLSLLGAGIGLGTVDTNAGSTPTPSSLGIGAGLWWVVSSCLALFAGGYVTAWLAGIETRFDGMLHGLVTWGIATLLICGATSLSYASSSSRSCRRAEQPALFELIDDSRPPSQRTAGGRYSEPMLFES
jgi:hypothetical protein